MRKLYKWIIALSLCVITPMCASATAVLSDLSVDDVYKIGMNCFYLEDYSSAASYFVKAGNYQEAKKWAYYCQAIDYVLSAKDDIEALHQAQIRFDLLAVHEFQQASQWAVYCKARQFEEQKLLVAAKDLYATIVVHDSIERYLACQDRENIFRGLLAENNQLRHKDLPIDEMYETAMNFYYLEDYALAADYFYLLGNYQEARQWRCFCTAIDLVVMYGNVEDAQLLFSLLCNQGFPEAQAWEMYCKAREYEKMGFISNALDLYKNAFVFDSSERYLKLSGE